MAVVAHWQLPVFRELRLEDSFVLSIRELPGELRFDMDLALGERHPSYRAPRDGAPQCFRRGRVLFRNVTDVTWATKNLPDANGEGESGDLGTIDSFVLDGGTYKLRGRWGKLELKAGAVDVDVW